MIIGAPLLATTDASASGASRTAGTPAQGAATTTPVRWTASWPALAGWGAALLQLALGAGLLTGVGWGAWSGVTGVSLVSLGACGLVWGAVALTRGRIVAPRVSVTTALLGIVLSTAALMVDPDGTSVVAVGAASALLMAVGIASAAAVRRGGVPRDARVGIVGMLIAATLVAAVVTPALGATEAGRNAPDHSSHTFFFDEHAH